MRCGRRVVKGDSVFDIGGGEKVTPLWEWRQGRDGRRGGVMASAAGGTGRSAAQGVCPQRRRGPPRRAHRVVVVVVAVAVARQKYSLV